MLTITIFAAGLVCLAGVLGLRLWRAQAQVSAVPAQASSDEPDERGITLQTLIVTAVLVLMAVAAGVVIVAITNNAADDLEQQATSIDSQCTLTEIYDPILASTGDRGVSGDANKIRGSAIGCIPVCIWIDSNATGDAFDGDSNEKIKSSEIKFRRNFSEDLSIAAKLATADQTVAVFTDSQTVAQGDANGDATNAKAISGLWDDNDTNLNNADELKVTPAQNACGVYDNQNRLVWQTPVKGN